MSKSSTPVPECSIRALMDAQSPPFANDFETSFVADTSAEQNTTPVKAKKSALTSPKPSTAKKVLKQVNLSSFLQKKNAPSTPKATPSKSTTKEVKLASNSPAKSPIKSSTKTSKSASKTESSTNSDQPEAKTPKTPKTPRALTPAAKKKRLTELQEKEEAIKVAIEKLKKEKSRFSAKLTKLNSAEIKFPIKDELLKDIPDSNIVALPEPYLQLSDLLPKEVVGDFLEVWNFLNVFSKQLSINIISLEDLIDLLSYNKRSCPALLDIYAALVKIIFSDSAISTKLSSSLPKRIGSKSEDIGLVIDDNSPIDESLFLSSNKDFDTKYNGLLLLPKKLSPALIDGLRLPCVLRSIILRLDPAVRLRKAVQDIAYGLYDSSWESNENVDDQLDSLLKFESDLFVSRKQLKSKSRLSFCHKIELRPEIMKKINTPLKKSNHHGSINLNKDAIFQITSEYISVLREVYETAYALEHKELHEISLSQKICLLKLLIETCYDTQRIREILENNAEERANQIQQMNRLQKEQKAKLKEVTNTKREAAIEICRTLNAEKLKNSSPSKSKKSKKGKQPNPKNQKDELDPTPEQLNAMIEELILLETYGIASVFPDPILEDISDDEEDKDEDDDEEEFYEEDEDGNLRRKRPVRNQSNKRNKALDRKKLQAEKQQRNTLIEMAFDKITTALETKSERDIKSAIKAAERANMKTTKGDGKDSCSESIKGVYKLLHEIDAKAKENKANLQHEKALEQYFVRTEHLGEDRFFNHYFQFIGDDNKLFIQSSQKFLEIEYNGPTPPSNSENLEDLILFRLFSSRPNRYRYTWSIYSSATELWNLCEALDERGEREKALKESIKARFELEEPTTQYQRIGSEWIGRKIERAFNKKIVRGFVVGWLPPTEEDAAIWHILHIDGDEEDLDESEMNQYLVPLESNDPSSFEETPETNDDDDEAEFEIQTKTKITYEPPIIKLQSGLAKGGVYSKTGRNPIAIEGLKLEISRFILTFQDELKKRGNPISREARKLWDNVLKVPCTFKELIPIILELENMIHSVQTLPDKHDFEEIKLAQEAEHQEMLLEGWLFETEQNEYIGAKVRKFYSGFGKSDGEIIAVLPADKNDGIALYRMLHSDGDKEDLDFEDLEKALRYYNDNCLEDETDPNNMEVENDEESKSEEETNDEDGVDTFAALNKDFLWANAEARKRWTESVSRANTTGELAVALGILEEQAFRFGVVTSLDPLQPLYLFNSTIVPLTTNNKTKAQTYKTEGGGHHSMLSPRKAKKRAMEDMAKSRSQILFDDDEDEEDNTPPSKRRSSNSLQSGYTDEKGIAYSSTGRTLRQSALRAVNYRE